MPLRHAYRTQLLGVFVLASSASSAQAIPDIVNPAALAPPVHYRSVFPDTPNGIAREEVDWKKANADVGQFKRGHIDILRWESAQDVKTPETTIKIAPNTYETRVRP